VSPPQCRLSTGEAGRATAASPPVTIAERLANGRLHNFMPGPLFVSCCHGATVAWVTSGLCSEGVGGRCLGTDRQTDGSSLGFQARTQADLHLQPAMAPQCPVTGTVAASPPVSPQVRSRAPSPVPPQPFSSIVCVLVPGSHTEAMSLRIFLVLHQSVSQRPVSQSLSQSVSQSLSQSVSQSVMRRGQQPGRLGSVGSDAVPV
jgi:hypothetical protein